MKKLTIGSAVYDDFEGVYFSYQSLRLNNLDIEDELDYLIIDNNPDSAEGKATKHFCEASQGIRYIPYTERRSTAVRNEVFNNAEGEFCMSIDCHVLFEPNTIKRLIKFFEESAESNDLYHGPMLYDQLNKHAPVSHMEPEWRNNMFGTWACSQKGKGQDPEDPPFIIPMHGLGIFASKTESWLGFNESFIGFGGEEGYIHKKYEKAGRKTWCLPFLRWVHRFDRPRGITYPLFIEERIRNYLIGHRELNLPYDDIIKHFGETQPHVNIDRIIENMDDPNFSSIIKNHTPKEEKENKKNFIMPQKMKTWSDSKITFDNPSEIRYIKYEILDSYDGHASLLKVDISSEEEFSPKILQFSSEDSEDRAEGFIEEGQSWQTDEREKGNFPHFITIDLQKKVKVSQITTFPRIGAQRGLPIEFKVYASFDFQEWQEVSHVNIMNE